MKLGVEFWQVLHFYPAFSIFLTKSEDGGIIFVKEFLINKRNYQNIHHKSSKVKQMEYFQLIPTWYFEFLENIQKFNCVTVSSVMLEIFVLKSFTYS